MAEEYRDLTRGRIPAADKREVIDLLTAGLYPVINIGEDELDALSTALTYAYMMYQSPYWPGREGDIPMLMLESGVYGLTSLVELLPVVNDLTPGYSLASRALDGLYTIR